MNPAPGARLLAGGLGPPAEERLRYRDAPVSIPVSDSILPSTHFPHYLDRLSPLPTATHRSHPSHTPHTYTYTTHNSHTLFTHTSYTPAYTLLLHTPLTPHTHLSHRHASHPSHTHTHTPGPHALGPWQKATMAVAAVAVPPLGARTSQRILSRPALGAGPGHLRLWLGERPAWPAHPRPTAGRRLGR